MRSTSPVPLASSRIDARSAARSSAPGALGGSAADAASRRPIAASTAPSTLTRNVAASIALRTAAGEPGSTLDIVHRREMPASGADVAHGKGGMREQRMRLRDRCSPRMEPVTGRRTETTAGQSGISSSARAASSRSADAGILPGWPRRRSPAAPLARGRRWSRPARRSLRLRPRPSGPRRQGDGRSRSDRWISSATCAWRRRRFASSSRSRIASATS